MVQELEKSALNGYENRGKKRALEKRNTKWLVGEEWDGMQTTALMMSSLLVAVMINLPI